MIVLKIIFFIVLQISISQQDEVPIKNKKFKLLSGDLMPAIGLGTAGITNSEEVKNVLDLALTAGYRHIDTATLYRNEEHIGHALKELLPKHNLTREDIFLTTKLRPDDLGTEDNKPLEDSLKKLQTNYVDLYLIHWPGPYKSNFSENYSQKRDTSWQQLIKAKQDGLARNIGVSNYHVKHLKQLLANDHGVKPSVNQFEWHPMYHPDELLALCNKEGIQFEAYSSLGSGNANLLKNPTVLKIAEKLNKTPAQILLRWAVQQNIAVIPKARSKKHLEENLELDFVISEEDMKTLGSFEQTKFIYDPNTIS